jgi:hypothetical protein
MLIKGQSIMGRREQYSVYPLLIISKYARVLQREKKNY